MVKSVCLLIQRPQVQFHLVGASGVKGDEWKYSAGEAWTREMGYILSRHENGTEFAENTNRATAPSKRAAHASSNVGGRDAQLLALCMPCSVALLPRLLSLRCGGKCNVQPARVDKPPLDFAIGAS